uniref:Uncharacterized protein n=1 Tax=Anguilla anguilla TaxID=7936 RepID=A0A0E9S585_ANGAN
MFTFYCVVVLISAGTGSILFFKVKWAVPPFFHIFCFIWKGRK